MLRVENLSVEYQGLTALSGVSLHVDQGEIISVIGPNGAGKTTLFKAISGTVPAASGSVTYEGQDLLGTRPSRRAHMGIAHVPEGRRVFRNMSVRDNLEMGAIDKSSGDLLDEMFTMFPVLADRRNQPAGNLSGGEQQMLALSRGLMSRPRLLMLDEPSMGLAPTIADEIFDRIQEISQSGDLTVLLVEQRAAEALELADRTYVLESGRIVLEGSSKDIATDDAVRKAYLGM
jgi:branched-chain amino acid transport system ATP-binding protein